MGESEEIVELKQKIESESQLRHDLDEKVAKMNQLLETGQEALAQEKKTVELLKQQLGDSSPTKTINGEDEPKDELDSPSTSQPGSVASLDSTPENGNDKKKSKKKKLLGLFK